MKRLELHSIKRKLVEMAMLASTTAVVLSCVIYLHSSRRAYLRNLTDRLEMVSSMAGKAVADGLGMESPPMMRLVQNWVRAQESVDRACVFGKDGRLLFQVQDGYFLVPLTSPELVTWDEEQVDSDRMIVVRPGTREGKTVGAIHVEANLREMNRHQAETVKMGLVTVVGARLVAYFLADLLPTRARSRSPARPARLTCTTVCWLTRARSRLRARMPRSRRPARLLPKRVPSA